MAERRPGPPRPGRPPALPRHGTLRLPAEDLATRRRATEVLAAAERERRRAREEGLAAGRAQAQEEAASLLASVRATAGRRLAGSEAELVRLALRIAERLIFRELQQDPAAVADLVAGLLRETRGQDPLVLRMNPADASALEQVQPRLAELVGVLPELQVEVDASLERGSCELAGPDVSVDARLPIRLAILEEVLLGTHEPQVEEERG